MVRNFFVTVGICGCLVLTGFTAIDARTAEGYRPSGPPPNASVDPAYCNTMHNIGRMSLGIANDGTFATGLVVGGSTQDCFTGNTLLSCEVPKGSRTRYCFGGALWLGAILGRDTLVSTGADGWARPGNEFHPDIAPFGKMIRKSIIDPAIPELYVGAVSEQDFIARYTDQCLTCRGVSLDPSGRAHLPLNIEVSQRTYAWSYSYAQDFVLFDYGIKNIGQDRLRRVFMGFYVDADIHDEAIQDGSGAQDDLNGFREWQPALYMPPGFAPDSDQVNLAWTVDNDGDMDPTQVAFQQVPHVTAMRIIRTPSDSLEVSFNWWVSNGTAYLDYGPQSRAKPRDFGTGGSGTPEGDRNKFFILSNGEFDFDQARTATIGSLDSIWMPPPGFAEIWATGLDTRYVLSFGPFDIEPGQTLPITLAYVAGVNFHKSFANFANLPDNPDAWFEGVNFESLGTNAMWASWVYDNPGVDTDSDGYAGKYRLRNLGGDSTWVCDTTWDSSVIPPIVVDTVCMWQYAYADTFYYEGDGVPDFRGATPPPPPSTYSTTDASGARHNGLRVTPSVGRLVVRWNGVSAENTPDVFSRELDFEGYRVYVARDDRSSSYSVAASYDIEDFNRWDFVDSLNSWVLTESPFTLRELRCLYAPDSCSDTIWDPLSYPRNHPLVVEGGPGEDPKVHYFTPQDFNQSILGNYEGAQTAIKKTYDKAPRPPVLDVDSIRVLFPNGADSVYLTADGFIKYYEYEFTLEGLLPTVPYWVNVTAFDYGSPSSGLASLETSPTLLPSVSYPQDAYDAVNPGATPVFVWPNPYRFDADYRDRGFEGRGLGDRPADRVRLIHFANLPAKATIRIYSLDGDLVREFSHPDPNPSAGCAATPHEACWDLITRNTQQVVSGLYYWTVEDDAGNIQIGKLVVIM